MQTFGQKAVGLSFNPSGDDAVSTAKTDYAKIIDQRIRYWRRMGIWKTNAYFSTEVQRW